VSCHDVTTAFVLLGLDGRAVRGRPSPQEVPAVAVPRPKSPDQGRLMKLPGPFSRERRKQRRQRRTKRALDSRALPATSPGAAAADRR
jgi:hypothetical protein